MKRNSYDMPTQVLFREDDDDSRWIGGIAFGNVVICGECGGTIELEDIADIKELSWVDISEEIRGDAV